MLLALTWFLLAILLGATAFFAGGMVLGAIGGTDVRDRMGQWYVDMAQAAYRNSALVVRETGSLQLTTVKFDPKFGADRSTVDGVAGHWGDPMAVKSTLSGKEFGIGLESASCYISPLASEFGKEGFDRLENGTLGEQDGEANTVILDYEIPQHPQITDLRNASKSLKGSCKRHWGELANKWGELSQEKFHEKISLGQSLLWMGAFGGGVALALATFYVRGNLIDGNGGGVDIAIQASTLVGVIG